MKSFLISLILTSSLLNVFAQTTQQRLNTGTTPQQLISEGLPLDSLYGKSYQSGIIFFYDTLLQRGMVMSEQDLHYAYDQKATKIFWNCVGQVTGATATEIWSGEKNTQIIVGAQCKLYEAEVKKWLLGPADLCTNYEVGGFTDWYLPSRDELNLVYLHLIKPGRYKLPQTLYWTSSEKNENFAWIQYMPDGGQAYYIKYYNHYVRAVHNF